MKELKHRRALLNIFGFAATVYACFIIMPANAATFVATDQTDFDTDIPIVTQPGHTDTIDATTAGQIDAGTSLSLPGAATSVNLEFGTLSIGANANDGTATFGPGTSVSFGQPGNPGTLNMGLGYSGTLNINGAAITFNVLDGNEDFNVGLDNGTGTVNMTSGSVTFDDSNATAGNFGTIAIAYPFGTAPANGSFNQSGGTVSLSMGALDIGISTGTTANGAYDLSNDALLRLAGGTVYIGQSTGGAGVLNVSGGAAFDLESIGTSGQLYVGDSLGDGTITQNGANSTVTLKVVNIAQFGSSAGNPPGPGGTGIYNLLAGTLQIGSAGAAFGAAPDGVGDLNQSGGVLLATAPVVIGENGTGTYDLSGGSANFAGNLLLGDTAGSAGTVNQTGGTLAISAGSLEIGVAGAGAYNLDGGVLQAGGANSILGSGPLNLGGGTLQVINSALSIGIPITLTGAGSIVDTNGLGATFGGVLSGTGGFTKLGLGTLSLTAANIYTGPTIVDGGTLAAGGTNVFSAGSAATAGAGGTLDLGGYPQTINSVTLDGGTIQNGTLTSAGGITSTGGTINGIGGSTGLTTTGGTTTISGGNLYAGATTVDGGILAAGGTNVFSAGSATTVQAGGTLDLGGQAQTINNVALAGGTIQNGTLTSAGGITSNGGTINGIGGTTGVLVAGGKTTALGANDYTGTTDITSGIFQIGNGTTATSLSGNIIDSGALVFNPDNQTVFAGVLSGAGSLSKIGAGTVILNANSSGFSGDSTVSAGTLEVGDAADPGAILGGNVTVGSGAVLRGHGTIGGSVDNQGTVFPGGSIGTLTVAGNYTQSSAATLNIEINPSPAGGSGISELVVNGAAALAGGLNVAVDSGNFTVGRQYEFLTAAGGVTGRFATVSYNPAFAAYISPTVIYQPNGAAFLLAPTPAVVTPNPAGPTPAPASTINIVSNAPAFASGRIYAANSFVQNQSLLHTLGTVMESFTPNLGAWLSGIGAFGRANGFAMTEQGFAAGNGFALRPNLTLGAALSNVYTATNSSQSNVNGSSVGVYGYGIYTAGKLRLSGIAGIGHIDESIVRGLPTLGLAGRAKSNGIFTDAGLRVQYTLGLGQAFVIPYAAIGYLHTGLGDARESGASILNLRYDAVNTNLGNAAAGVTAGTPIPVRFGMLVPWVAIGANASIGNTRIGNTETLGLFRATETATDAPGTALTAGAGFNLAGRGPWRLSAFWTGQYGDSTSLENFTLTARYIW